MWFAHQREGRDLPEVRGATDGTANSEPSRTYERKRQEQVVAGVLALLLGGLGVHKFYLGKGFQGLMYLLFCWTFIPALIGLVEGLNYLLMSEKTFFERYGA
jgi:TM2 domain-containing membrane protein YozV